MNTVIIIQARMNSTRLPGKVLKTVLEKTLLEYQIERLRRVVSADEIVIATTTNDVDEPIVNLCSSLSVPCFRGSEEDVLARYHGAAQAFGADVVVRVTSDCPLIDPGVVSRVIEFYLTHHNDYHYVSNVLERSYPRGMDTEVFSFKTLNEAYLEAKTLSQREHVTPYIYNNVSKYRLANVSNCCDQSSHRWTVDTPEDFELIRRIIEALYPVRPEFSLEDILGLLAENQGWSDINRHIEQKKAD